MNIEITHPWADIGDTEFAVKRWAPPADFSAGEFRDRTDPTRWAAIHRSTKRPDKWQVSWFDAEGAIGDTERSVLTDALRELPPGSWEHVS